jgi:DNA-binding MarR family transcriptional regulator
MKKKETDKLKSAGRLISEIARVAHVYFQQEVKQYAIGHAQIRTLFFIAHHEGLTQMELAKYLKLDKSSITSQVQILERNGYISRQTAETDARKQVIHITGKTRKILKPMKKVLSGWTDILLDGFNNNEKTEIYMYLEKMRDNARKKIDETHRCKLKKTRQIDKHPF